MLLRVEAGISLWMWAQRCLSTRADSPHVLVPSRLPLRKLAIQCCQPLPQPKRLVVTGRLREESPHSMEKCRSIDQRRSPLIWRLDGEGMVELRARSFCLKLFVGSGPRACKAQSRVPSPGIRHEVRRPKASDHQTPPPPQGLGPGDYLTKDLRR